MGKAICDNLRKAINEYSLGLNKDNEELYCEIFDRIDIIEANINELEIAIDELKTDNRKMEIRLELET